MKPESNQLFFEILSLAKLNEQQLNENKLKKTIEFIEKIHEGELTETNEPMINHALRTGKIAAKIGADEETILAAILHNSIYALNHPIKDKLENKEIVKKKFGENILELIESIKKIITVENKNKNKLNEIAETVLVASANDPKIILLRLILRLEKMNITSKNMENYALDTLNIYVPIAHKLGIYSIKALMEDECFKILEPKKFKEIKTKIEKNTTLREKELKKIIEKIKTELEQNKIPAKINSRKKTIYSIYQKMLRKKVPITEIYDVNAIRIITNTIENCYNITGIINFKWKNIPEEYDDYISKPKTNFYQSIHMAIIGPNEKPVEVQIRTNEMHELAEFGVASHVLYKGHKKSVFDLKFNLLNQINKLRKQEKEKINFNIQNEKIVVLTPKGEAIILPINSTPIDFAYAIHSDLGQKCEKAKINNKLVSLDTILTNLDTVEIITSTEQKPKLSWLSFVKTSKAKAKINQFFNIFSKKKNEKINLKNKLIVTENDSRIKLAKCCSPLPGDEIIAITTTKRKYSVHKKDCEQLKKLKEKEKIEVEWGQEAIKNQETEIMITAKEKPNLLIEILKKINSQKTPITNAKVITKEKTLKIIIQLKAKNLKQLNKILNEISKINGVLKAKRN